MPVRKGFISYAHADHALLASFLTHLRAIERAYEIAFWWDKSIHAGARWSDAIAKAIADADMALLMITPNLIASDYVIATEIPAIQSRYAAGALVVPVVLRQTMWQHTCGALQAVPTTQGLLKPIVEWRPQDNGNHAACTQLAAAVQDHFAITPHQTPWPAP